MIYVASSWKNTLQPHVVARLRESGYNVYDFRHPIVGNDGFSWAQIYSVAELRNVPLPELWDASIIRDMLKHPIAETGFALDFAAMACASACVLVQPSGRSAHLEFGWIVGRGKPGFVLMDDVPDLMVKVATGLAVNLEELMQMVSRHVPVD